MWVRLQPLVSINIDLPLRGTRCDWRSQKKKMFRRLSIYFRLLLTWFLFLFPWSWAFFSCARTVTTHSFYHGEAPGLEVGAQRWLQSFPPVSDGMLAACSVKVKDVDVDACDIIYTSFVYPNTCHAELSITAMN